MAAGVKNVIGCDQFGALYEDRREHMNWVKDWYARSTNPDREQGSVHDVIKGRMSFSVYRPGVIGIEDLKRMAEKPLSLRWLIPLLRSCRRADLMLP